MKTKKKIAAFLSIATIGMTLAACSVEDTNPEKVDKSDTVEEVDSSTEDIVGTEVFNMGDTVKMGSLEYTVHGVRTDKGSDIFGADEGNKYVYIDVTVENIGNEEEHVSSLMQFSLVDMDGVSQDIAIGADGKGSVDGSIGSGRKLRGELTYEVNEGLSEAELEIDGALLSSGIAVFALEF